VLPAISSFWSVNFPLFNRSTWYGQLRTLGFQRNFIGLAAIQPPEAIAISRKLHWIQSLLIHYIIHFRGPPMDNFLKNCSRLSLSNIQIKLRPKGNYMVFYNGLFGFWYKPIPKTGDILVFYRSWNITCLYGGTIMEQTDGIYCASKLLIYTACKKEIRKAVRISGWKLEGVL
jgi:hypothetical protein